MNEREGFSFQDAVQAALAEEDSAESDLAPTAVEVAGEEDSTDIEQPDVESNETPGLFDKMFIEKQPKESEQPVNEDSLTFNVDGVQRTIEELKAGYMRQDDYTRKTQEVSQVRKTNENAIALWEALEARPQETVRALWNKVSQGQSVTPQPAKQDVDVEALVEQRVQEALANDPRVRELETQKALDRVVNTIQEIEAQNDLVLGESDVERILERADELGTGDLHYAFYTLDKERRAFEAQQRNAQQNSPVRGLGTPEEQAPQGPANFGSWREAMNDTLQRENIRDTIFVS